MQNTALPVSLVVTDVSHSTQLLHTCTHTHQALGLCLLQECLGLLALSIVCTTEEREGGGEKVNKSDHTTLGLVDCTVPIVLSTHPPLLNTLTLSVLYTHHNKQTKYNSIVDYLSDNTPATSQTGTPYHNYSTGDVSSRSQQVRAHK